MILRKRPKYQANIPTTSMSDIAFLLIVFYMLTSVFATQKGLQIVLPEKGKEIKVRKTNIINVFVNMQGQVKIGEEEVSLAEIKEKAELLLSENDSLIFSLTVDRKCKYDKVTKVFDELRQANALRIAFASPRDVSP
ncbi:MAG: biopolymer transporter ExbD [Candidatus Stahlbacteria bacterium]|nr:biopolymer transporter ExbD [Candidatus Stahlbacteria bacterium]